MRRLCCVAGILSLLKPLCPWLLARFDLGFDKVNFGLRSQCTRMREFSQNISQSTSNIEDTHHAEEVVQIQNWFGQWFCLKTTNGKALDADCRHLDAVTALTLDSIVTVMLHSPWISHPTRLQCGTKHTTKTHKTHSRHGIERRRKRKRHGLDMVKSKTPPLSQLHRNSTTLSHVTPCHNTHGRTRQMCAHRLTLQDVEQYIDDTTQINSENYAKGPTQLPHVKITKKKKTTATSSVQITLKQIQQQNITNHTNNAACLYM